MRHRVLWVIGLALGIVALWPVPDRTIHFDPFAKTAASADTNAFEGTFWRNQNHALVVSADPNSTVPFTVGGTVTLSPPYADNTDTNTPSGVKTFIGVSGIDANGNIARLHLDASDNVLVAASINGTVATAETDFANNQSTSALQCAVPCSQTLVGTGNHTIYFILFASAVPMVSGQCLTAYDNTTNVQDATHPYLINCGQFAGNGVFPFPGGLHIRNGVTITISGTALTASQFVTAAVR